MSRASRLGMMLKVGEGEKKKRGLEEQDAIWRDDLMQGIGGLLRGTNKNGGRYALVWEATSKHKRGRPCPPCASISCSISNDEGTRSSLKI